MMDLVNISGLILNIVGVGMLFKKETPKVQSGGVDTAGNLDRIGEITYNTTALIFILLGFVLQVLANIGNLVLEQ